MNVEDKKEIALLIKETLHQEIKEILGDNHEDQHAYIKMLLEQDKIKKERFEKIKTSVLGWFILAVLGGIGASVWHYLEDFL